MPYNGVGVYVLPSPEYPAVPGTTILAEDRNAIDQDLKQALSIALPRDGQAAMTGNLNFGGFSISNLLGISDITAMTAAVAGCFYTGNHNFITQPPGTNSTLAATCAFVIQQAFQAALPAQAGNSGKYLTTDGVNATWQFNDPRIVRVARTANIQLGAADRAKLVDYTGSVNFTQTFASPATLGDGWYLTLQNSGTAEVEIEAPATVTATSTTSASIGAGTNWTIQTGLVIPAGSLVIIRRTSDPFEQRITGTVTSYNSGTGALVIVGDIRFGVGTFTDWTLTFRPATAGIDGIASYVIYPNEVRTLYCDGLTFRSIVQEVYSVTRTTTRQQIRPPGYVGLEMDLVGGGGGGGSGCRAAASNNRQGGAPGGAPARVSRRYLGLPSNVIDNVVIGSNGTGGAAQTVDSTAGIAGTAGGNTSYGSLATAFGGVGGAGGLIAGTASVTTSGSGSAGVGSSGAGASNQRGGLPSSATTFGSPTAPDTLDEGGAGAPSASGTAGGCSVWGGAGSATYGANVITPIALSGSSLRGVPAGGVGGWISDTNAVPATAGAAGLRNSYSPGGLTGGTCGGAPTVGTAGATAANDSEVGGSGSGGGSSNTVAAQPGGVGGFPGGAGGGGGASVNGQPSGAGANGAAGRAKIVGVL